MEDVLGGRTDASQFAVFLSNWQAILERRVEQAVGGLTAVEGVRGLVLAGSLGRNAAWPLSDIDLLPVYDAARMEAAAAEVERRRLPLLEQWIAEGWWTGLDIGRLRFTVDEADRATSSAGQALPAILDDDRVRSSAGARLIRQTPALDVANLGLGYLYEISLRRMNESSRGVQFTS